MLSKPIYQVIVFLERNQFDYYLEFLMENYEGEVYDAFKDAWGSSKIYLNFDTLRDAKGFVEYLLDHEEEVVEKYLRARGDPYALNLWLEEGKRADRDIPRSIGYSIDK